MFITTKLRQLGPALRRFLAEAPHSLSNHLNRAELARVLSAAMTAGGGAFGLVYALFTNVGSIFPSPADAALAAAVLTGILEALRRLGHGAPVARGLSTRR